MNKPVIRPTRLSADQFDGAVQEALQRIAQVRTLTMEECGSISGGSGVTQGPAAQVEA